MTYKNANKMVALAILLIVFLTISLTPFSAGIALAVDEYSNVMTDLEADPNFDASEYEVNRSDYSITLIQIAESENKKLYVYTYQPNPYIKAIVASKINMSLTEKVDGTKLYDLKLVSREGVFAKYEVSGVIVSSAKERNYNISTIYRPWIAGVDSKADAPNNEINAIAYKVGQIWTAKTANDTVKYSAKDIEVVTVTSQMIGFRRYSDGLQWDGLKNCDSHYIAFNCDHEIDNILNADIEFIRTPYKQMEGQEPKFEAPVSEKVTLEDYQVASNDGSGWFGEKNEWHRIASVADFLAEVKSDDPDFVNTMSKYDWVLNFYETSYERDVGGVDIVAGLLGGIAGIINLIVKSCTTRGTLITDVTLLRLEFKYNGEVYNLGVVADTQTGSSDPAEQPGNAILKWFKEHENTLKIVGIAVIAVVAVIIILIIISLFRSGGGGTTKVYISSGSKATKKKSKK